MKRATVNGTNEPANCLGCEQEGCIGMFMPNGYEAPTKEHVEYGEDGELICNMQGNGWESLPYPIIIDTFGYTEVSHTASIML